MRLLWRLPNNRLTIYSEWFIVCTYVTLIQSGGVVGDYEAAATPSIEEGAGLSDTINICWQICFAKIVVEQ